MPYGYFSNYLFLWSVSTTEDHNTLEITITTIINDYSTYGSFSHFKHEIKDHHIFHYHIAPYPHGSPYPQDSVIPISVGKKLYTLEQI